MLRRPHPFTSLAFLLLFFVTAVSGAQTVQLCGTALLLLLSVSIKKRRRAWQTIGLTVVPIGGLLILVNSGLGLPVSESISYALRLFLLMTPLVIVVNTASPDDFSVAIRTVPIPSRLHYIFIFSFQIIQSLRDVFQSVRVAQQLRGFRLERRLHMRWKNIFPLLFPVTLIAISQSLERSLAFEFKGIESPAPKTYLRKLQFSVVDKIAITVLLLSSLALIFARLASP